MGYIKLTFRVTQEGKHYVAECLELGTSSCGDSPEEAGANIVEATELYLDTLEELGECTQVLQQKGVLVREDRFPEVRALFQPNAHSHSFIAQLPVGACA